MRMIYIIKTDKTIAYESRLSMLKEYGKIKGYSVFTSSFSVESDLDLLYLRDVEWIFSVVPYAIKQ